MLYHKPRANTGKNVFLLFFSLKGSSSEKNVNYYLKGGGQYIFCQSGARRGNGGTGLHVACKTIMNDYDLRNNDISSI